MLKHPSLRDIQMSSVREERNWEKAIQVDYVLLENYRSIVEQLPSEERDKDPLRVKLYFLERAQSNHRNIE